MSRTLALPICITFTRDLTTKLPQAHTAPENAGKILWVTYEQLTQEVDATIARIAEFVGVALTPELLEKVKVESSFGTMEKINERTERDQKRNFFRKGEIGDWRNHFSEAQSKEFDQLYEERLGGLGLQFDFGGGLVM